MANPIQNNRIQELVQSQPTITKRTDTAPVDRNVFQEILQDRLKLSGHAATRLQSRNIELDAAQWERVMEGVQKAADKGARESLVMIDDIALVVSVKNKTVITAVDQQGLRENVFTNIDSAVIV